MKTKMIVWAMCTAFAAHAQFTSGGGGAFSIGAMSAPLNKLAPFSPGVEMPGNTAFSWGGYGYFQFQKVLIGFKGYGYYGSAVETATDVINHDGGAIMLELGYKVVNQERLFVYPFVGAGFGGLAHGRSAKGNVTLGETAPAPTNFSASWSGAVFDVGFRIEKMLNIGERSKGERGGGMVGFEAGYQFSAESTNWRTTGGGDVLGAPAFAFNGWYVRAILGGFGGK